MAENEPTASQLEDIYRPRLEAELAELENQSAGTSGDRAPVELDQQSVGRLSRMDALQQQSMAKAVEQRRLGRQSQLKKALLRIDDGEFGYCTECGEFIGSRRLDIDPTVAHCVRCADGAGH